jgi:hypothetical protein
MGAHRKRQPVTKPGLNLSIIPPALQQLMRLEVERPDLDVPSLLSGLPSTGRAKKRNTMCWHRHPETDLGLAYVDTGRITERRP